MLCKISSPEKVIFNGKVEKITIPTESGDITVLPGHMPLVSVVKPGIVTIWPSEKNSDNTFVFSDEKASVSVSKGMLYVDGKNISIVTSAATTSPEDSSTVLRDMKKSLEEKIAELKKQGSIEEIERSLIKLEKIRADIKLAQIQESK